MLDFRFPDKYYLSQLEKGFQPRSSRRWAVDVKKLYNNKCFITQTPSTDCKLVAHHLYSKKDNRDLEFSLFNGIALRDDLHKLFHKNYGLKTKPDHLIDFIAFFKFNSLLLSNKERIELCTWISFLDSKMIENKQKIKN